MLARTLETAVLRSAALRAATLGEGAQQSSARSHLVPISSGPGDGCRLGASDGGFFSYGPGVGGSSAPVSRLQSAGDRQARPRQPPYPSQYAI